MYKTIPTYKNGKWSETKFESIEDFRSFIDCIFKEPGKYNFDKTALLFNEQAINFKDLVILILTS